MPKKSSKTEEENKEKKEVVEKKEAPKLSVAEYEKKVLDLAEKGMTSEKIGQSLKSQGIHPQEYPKKISKILKEKGKYVIADVKNVEGKLEGIAKHYSTNKQDKRAMREKDRVFAQLRKLKKYHKLPLK